MNPGKLGLLSCLRIRNRKGLTPMKTSTILDHIDSGHMALPKFQRGYVWNRDQVRSLFDSLYRRHPVVACWSGQLKPLPLRIGEMDHLLPAW